MRRTSLKWFLAGLALCPALALVGGIVPPDVGLGAGIGVYGVAAVALLVAFGGTVRFGSDTQNSAPSKKAAFALRRGAAPVMPPTGVQIQSLKQALHPQRSADFQDGPMRADEAVAWVLRRAMLTLSLSCVDDADADDIRTLFLLSTLVQATPGEAGSLAQQFRRPDAVLAIRDHVANVAAIRTEWERGYRVYMATRWLWMRQLHKTSPQSLRESLISMSVPDIDLWHRVVLEHDSADPNHSAAALWCVQNTACDRATVAAYLAQIVLDGSLQTAARRNNTAYLEAIRNVILAWNTGAYKTAELALDPPDALVSAGKRLPDVLDSIARHTGEARWPEPRGAFTAHEGRAPHTRPEWDLATGRILHEPSPEHYIHSSEAPMAPNALTIA